MPDITAPAKPKRETKAEFESIPVIFANGEDDDLAGLVAALRNEKFQYGDRVYRPFERLVILGRVLVISRPIHVKGRGGPDAKRSYVESGPEWIGEAPEPVIILEPDPSRKILIKDS